MRNPPIAITRVSGTRRFSLAVRVVKFAIGYCSVACHNGGRQVPEDSQQTSLAMLPAAGNYAHVTNDIYFWIYTGPGGEWRKTRVNKPLAILAWKRLSDLTTR